MSDGCGTTKNFSWQYRDGVLIVRLMEREAVITGPVAETAIKGLIGLCEEIRNGEEAYGYLADVYLSGLLQGVLAGTRGNAALGLEGKYDG